MPPGEKAALFYHRLDEVCGVVTELLKDSIRQGEMCRFMFRTPPEIMRERIKNHGLDMDAEPSIETIHLSQALIAGYDGSGVGEQLRAFANKAKDLGYTGARLILNMPEVMAGPSSSTSGWSELETVRDELGMTMVCLYDASILPPGFLLRSLSSYPKVIIDGTLCRNFYYVPSVAFPQRDAYRDLYEQLGSIREELDIRQNEDRERSKLMEMNRELQEEMAQRRMVEFALLRAENNLRTMLDAMPEMVFMIDRDLRVTMGNRTFLSFLEATGADASYEGKPVYDLFPGAPTGGRRLFEEVFHYGYPTVVEDSIMIGNGRVDMEIRLVPVMMGDKVDRVVAMARPKQTNAREIEDMWSMAEVLKKELLDPAGPEAGSVEYCPHPVLVTGRDGKLLKVNHALGRMLGLSPDKVMELGSAYSFLSPLIDANGAVQRVVVDGKISIPSILTLRDGTKLEVMCYIVNIGEGFGSNVLAIITPRF